MNILITGAQFSNKGAQSLLFSTMDALRKNFDNVEIFYMPLDEFSLYKENIYKFHMVYGRWEAHLYENSLIKRPYVIALAIARRILRQDAVSPLKIFELHKLLPKIDAILDVSGFQLTSQFDNACNNLFLDYIEEAKRYNKTIILMPQSFGPFDYSKNKDEMMKRIGKVLPKADLIFVREKEGYERLKKEFSLKNIVLSTDLVLQTGNIDLNNIFTNIPELKYPHIEKGNNVGIIPNNEMFKRYNVDDLLNVYTKIVLTLLSHQKKIYIFRHSNDMQACNIIYNQVKGLGNVFLVEDELNCIEYSLFIEQFDYIIASRYHAIVHAYKKGVPAVVLGWAEKYRQLAIIFDQNKYIFDVSTVISDNSISICDAICCLNNNYRTDSEKIINKLAKLGNNGCFDKCFELLRNL